MIILDKPQAELLRSFLVGHSKEIENSEHANAMLEIQKILFSQMRPDEEEVCDIILQNVDLLTCINCGAKLSDKVRLKDDVVGVLHIDPGSSNYPREPDEPAAAYFECAECSEAHPKGFLRYRLKKEENT